MRKPLGRLSWRPSSYRPVLASLAVAIAALPALPGCGSGEPAFDVAPRPELGQTSAALTSSGPDSVAFGFDLEGQHFELALERAPAPTSQAYTAYRLTRDRKLVAMPPADLACSYRGRALPVGASEDAAGFAAMNVCASATGHAPGEAASGVIRAAGRFWRLSPDPADVDPSDGVDHLAQPLHRLDTPVATPEPARRVTLARLPESPAPRLAFREGTDEETKYIDLVVVSDAARVAELGGQTQASTIDFVNTMNALLEGSGLVPRLRVTLRAQVLFDQDPYSPAFEGDEVNNDSLLNEFLDWANTEDLPVHDEHLLLSGLDFVGGVVGYAGLGVACFRGNNGAIVQAGGASGGFPVLSAVHEIGHTIGMNHDDGSSPGCPQQGFIMAAVGCGNCPGADEAAFSSCSIDQFQEYLAGPQYGTRCIDDVPLGGAPSCGDGVIQEGESCDCGAEDCSDIDPCCDGATCQLQDGAECSDFNDGCCQNCAIISAEAEVVCRAQRSVCDIAEVCNGVSKECPADTFEPAGDGCVDERGNSGACYFGDCRSRGTQCEQIAESQSGTAFDNVGAPGPGCPSECNQVVCGNGPNGCLFITGPAVNDGVPCEGGGQCVNQQCVTTIDQCPDDPDKTEPGDCGCNTPDADGDGDDVADCADACPDDAAKVQPGACGCGTPDLDADADGTPDCSDECPSDAAKTEPGECGCGSADTDTDGDDRADCVDECPTDPAFVLAGACGCGIPATDADSDGSPDCVDLCPNDAARVAPPCGPPPAAEQGGTPSPRDSDDGGCSVAAGGTQRTSGGPGGMAGLAAQLGVLALVARRWRRRAR